MSYTFPKNKFNFYFDQKKFLWFKKYVSPSTWINDNFYLGKGYVIQGKLTLYRFQEMVVDTILKFKRSYIIAPAQTGKSMLLETMLAYFIDMHPAHMMVVYETEVKAKSIFVDKLEPMVRDNPAIRKYWSGAADDLTQSKITLQHLIIRIGHAGVRSRNSISSHPAGRIIADEFAKWPTVKGFDQIAALRGRTESTKLVGKDAYEYYCTTPVNDQDLSYREVHKEATLLLRFFFPCPYCEKLMQISDRNIIEIPNKYGVKDHNPYRILHEKAAYIQCPHCLGEIDDFNRKKMLEKCELLPVDKKDKLKIITPSRKYDEVAINWNRLIVPYYTIYQCLHDFFSAYNSGNSDQTQTYINETMADWVKVNSAKIDKGFLYNKSKKHNYKQRGIDSKFPAFVKILIAGIDSQDDGFYLVVRGYGMGMESILVREKFIYCRMCEQGNEQLDEVFNKFFTEVYKKPYIRSDGVELPIYFGFIDRGGHRAQAVDYLCTRLPWLHPYIGSPREAAPLIERSKTSSHYMGNTKNLSRIVNNRIQSEYFHLCVDFSKEYAEQLLSQYDEEYIDTRGVKKRRWIVNLPDHYRDCENLCEAAVILNNLQIYTFSEDRLNEAEQITMRTQKQTIKKQQSDEKNNIVQDFKNQMDTWGW